MDYNTRSELILETIKAYREVNEYPSFKDVCRVTGIRPRDAVQIFMDLESELCIEKVKRATGIVYDICLFKS